MPEQKAANDPVTAANMASALDNLAQIREILFGDQIRDLEQRIVGLEARWQEREDLLRTEFARGLERLQTHLGERLAALDAALEAERAARTTELAEAGRGFRELSDGLTTELRQLDADVTDEFDALRRELTDRLGALADQVATEQTQLDRRLQQEHAALRSEKLAGATLAGLLEELAGRLRDPADRPS